jgi:NitT/TauT family transport system ATP-binding protein
MTDPASSDPAVVGTAGERAGEAAPRGAAGTDHAPGLGLPTGGTDAAVVMAGVARSFPVRPQGRILALDGIDLAVGHREIVAIVGPNGSGKSTLLRLIGGLLSPDTGSVVVEGRAVAGPDPAVGFVFQEPRLLPWRSSLDNVAYPLELAGVERRARTDRAADLLRLVGLGPFGEARPSELSGGMRQRVAIARALALGPSVLLLDEPFSALDSLTRDRFNLELLRLWERTATTIVLVTHSIPEAVFLADRVLVLSPRPGRIVAEIPSPLGRPRSVAELDSPGVAAASARIRAVLGTPGDPPAPEGGSTGAAAEPGAPSTGSVS